MEQTPLKLSEYTEQLESSIEDIRIKLIELSSLKTKLESEYRKQYEKDKHEHMAKYAIPDEKYYKLTKDDLEFLTTDELHYILYLIRGKSLSHIDTYAPYLFSRVSWYRSESTISYKTTSEYRDAIIELAKKESCIVCGKISHKKDQCTECFCKKCKVTGHYDTDKHCKTCLSAYCDEKNANFVNLMDIVLKHMFAVFVTK